MLTLNSGHTVSKISHPQLCPELAVYAVVYGNGFPADGSADLFTPENTDKPHNRHETCHSASDHSGTFPKQLTPDFTHIVYARYLFLQAVIALRTGIAFIRMMSLLLTVVIR